jgi:CRP-like cAMP-binding protein
VAAVRRTAGQASLSLVSDAEFLHTLTPAESDALEDVIFEQGGMPDCILLVRGGRARVAARGSDGTGPLVCFTLDGAERAQRFLGALELVAETTSFGGVHSSAERRARWATDAVPEGFIRFSAGCEDAEDLLADVEQALAGN